MPFRVRKNALIYSQTLSCNTLPPQTGMKLTNEDKALRGGLSLNEDKD
jgi:hypothetical protein